MELENEQQQEAVKTEQTEGTENAAGTADTENEATGDKERELFGRITSLLASEELTIPDAAIKAGIENKQMYRYVMGLKVPSAFDAYRIARAFGVPTDWLIGGSQIPNMVMLKDAFLAGTDTVANQMPEEWITSAWRKFCEARGYPEF